MCGQIQGSGYVRLGLYHYCSRIQYFLAIIRTSNIQAPPSTGQVILQLHRTNGIEEEAEHHVFRKET